MPFGQEFIVDSDVSRFHRFDLDLDVSQFCRFYLDSGATHHVLNVKCYFISMFV